MVDKYAPLRESVSEALVKIKEPEFAPASDAIRKEMEKAYRQGVLRLGDDISLSGFALEIRVKRILNELGLPVTEGRRRNLEDLIVNARDDFTTPFPLAVEVKGTNRAYVVRRELRELDDWVFELSGEEKIRRRRRPPRTHGKYVYYWTAGLPPGPDSHPTPHKGVLVFNGPLGMHFEERSANCINPNDLEFVHKRYFCIIPFQILLDAASKVASKDVTLHDLWEKIHQTEGVLCI
jgi:hypothetical protein